MRNQTIKSQLTTLSLFTTLGVAAASAGAPPNAGTNGIPFVSASTDSKMGLVTATHRHGEQAAVNSPDGKTGTVKGCATHHAFLLGIVQWGTDDVGAAAKRAGIVQVKTVGHGGNSILWGILYYSHSTIVTGESTVDSNGTQYMK